MNVYQSPTPAYPAPRLPVWQRGGLPTICGAITRWMVVLPAHHAQIVAFGVRQPCCRTNRASCHARVTRLTLLVTAMLWVLVTIIESVRNE
ncbi:MAG TPA: hypothetical protein DEF43_19010 [Chloroflexus aurantiacus]|nr:hypothetical protein [Chloroflexus aurantiacus]